MCHISINNKNLSLSNENKNFLKIKIKKLTSADLKWLSSPPSTLEQEH